MVNKTQQYNYLYVINLINFYNISPIKTGNKISIRIPYNAWLKYYGYKYFTQFGVLYGFQQRLWKLEITLKV